MGWLATVTVTHEIWITGRERPDEGEIVAGGYGDGDIVDVGLASLERMSPAEYDRQHAIVCRRSACPPT